ncbi:MAG: hypothetical protein HYY40_01585 [Bacteroidetes bacterium]|nr:hypothetical protein [Bacteroidota bacterium]
MLTLNEPACPAYRQAGGRQVCSAFRSAYADELEFVQTISVSICKFKFRQYRWYGSVMTDLAGF